MELKRKYNKEYQKAKKDNPKLTYQEFLENKLRKQSIKKNTSDDINKIKHS